MCVCVCVCVASQGLAPAVAQRLAEWTVVSGRVQLLANGDHATHVTSLTHTVPQLRDLHTTAPVRLRGWQWDAELLAAFAAGLPALPHLTFDVDMPNTMA